MKGAVSPRQWVITRTVNTQKLYLDRNGFWKADSSGAQRFPTRSDAELTFERRRHAEAIELAPAGK